MPVMNGFDAAMEIRKMADTKKAAIPIIALTASMLNTQMDQIGAAGMNDYILKPFEPDNLFEKLSRYQKQ